MNKAQAVSDFPFPTCSLPSGPCSHRGSECCGFPAAKGIFKICSGRKNPHGSTRTSGSSSGESPASAPYPPGPALGSRVMELVKFCICLIAPRALREFPDSPFPFSTSAGIFLSPLKGWQMALWKGTDVMLSCHFGLFCPQNGSLGLALPWGSAGRLKNEKN